LQKLLAALLCASLLLAGCGGGGGSDVAGSSGGSSGTGTGTGTGTGSTPGYNVVNAVVDDGPAALAAASEGAANILYVKVTVCVPGSTTNCQTIDHVQVDTGSQGLRLIDSAVNSTLLSALQPISMSGGSLAECVQFVDGFSWGPMVRADLHVGGADSATSGESAPNLPVQIIGTSTFAVPSDCASAGLNNPENTVVAFGANGIIGVGLFDQDCGAYCDQIAGISNGNNYYTCTSSGCTGALVPVTSQMINPVYGLAANNGITDNNGVIIELPAVAATGAATVSGTMIFGIGTQSNNALASGATVLTTDPDTGYVSTNLAALSQTDSMSYFDSGSNAIYFEDGGIPNCNESYAMGFFCPASTTVLTANVTGANNQVAMVNFSIAAADTLFSTNPTYTAFSDLGGSAGSAGANTFAWGLPFYFGHNVYTAMQNVDAGGTNGPYFAF
jgi:hypothetical protein